MSNTHLNHRILNLMWKKENENEKSIAYLITMMTAMKTASLSDARGLGVERECRLDGHGIELKFLPPSSNC